MATSWAEHPPYRPRHARLPRRRRRILATTGWGALIALAELAMLTVITPVITR